MFKNITILIFVAAILMVLIITAGTLVLNGSPALALLPVSMILLGVMVYIKKYSA